VGGELDKVQQAVILCCLNGVQEVNDRLKPVLGKQSEFLIRAMDFREGSIG
jgi:hypothetical protein